MRGTSPTSRDCIEIDTSIWVRVGVRVRVGVGITVWLLQGLAQMVSENIDDEQFRTTTRSLKHAVVLPCNKASQPHARVNIQSPCQG